MPADGRHALRELPADVCSVTLQRGGRVAVGHPKVPVPPGRGIKIDAGRVPGTCTMATDRR
ncbi:MAG: hypothetical protein KGN77_08065 [Xanthomonadaceae bacterium]|nr:hypothetical protein [Xanthomonadaceae bacterium]MDE1963358.1 hypothetical protein [Xanthomonadaceae bacterium]